MLVIIAGSCDKPEPMDPQECQRFTNESDCRAAGPVDGDGRDVLCGWYEGMRTETDGTCSQTPQGVCVARDDAPGMFGCGIGVCPDGSDLFAHWLELDGDLVLFEIDCGLEVYGGSHGECDDGLDAPPECVCSCGSE